MTIRQRPQGKHVGWVLPWVGGAGRAISYTCWGVWLKDWKLLRNSQGFVCLGFYRLVFAPVSLQLERP